MIMFRLRLCKLKKQRVMINISPLLLYMMAPNYKRNVKISCGICFDDQPKDAPYVLIDGSPICKDCFLTDIEPRFNAAIDNEDAYPVTWSSIELSPMDLPGFTASFKTHWKAQERFIKYLKSKECIAIRCMHLTRQPK